MKEGLKIGLACFLGAFIGAFITLEFNHSILMAIVGVITGGLSGYILYDPKQVLVTARKVWESMPEWNKVKSDIHMLMVVLSTALSLSSALFFFIVNFEFFFSNLNAHKTLIRFFGSATQGIWICSINSILLLAIAAWVFKRGKSFFGDDNWKVVTAIIATSPFMMSLSIISIIVICPIYLVVHFFVPAIKLVWRTFKLIHSDERLLCMTDAAIGAVIGYFSGSALIGGIAGAILGVLNYEIVSVRWLKLKPISVAIEEA